MKTPHFEKCRQRVLTWDESLFLTLFQNIWRLKCSRIERTHQKREKCKQKPRGETSPARVHQSKQARKKKQQNEISIRSWARTKVTKNNNKFDSIYLSFFPVILHLTFKSNNKTKRYYRKQAKLFICTNKVKKYVIKLKQKKQRTAILINLKERERENKRCITLKHSLTCKLFNLNKLTIVCFDLFSNCYLY